jgi:hypothetical protein
MFMRKLCSLVMVAGFVAIAGCGGGGGGGYGGGGNPNDPGGGGGNNNPCPSGTVCMLASSFNPTSVTVNKGTTVTFNNNSLVDHNIVFDAPVPEATTDIGPISYGSSTTRVFNTAGTYNFHCTIHAGMTGKVIAQ